MAKEKAIELVKKLEENKNLKALFEKDPKAALEAGDYGCTFKEFKEAVTLGRELDEKELDSVSGGYTGGSDGKGSCVSNSYKEKCAATVEIGSWCGSNDWCETWDELYTWVV